MAPQRYGREVDERKDASQCPDGAHSDAERSRQDEEWSQRLRYLIEAWEFRTRLEAASPVSAKSAKAIPRCRG